MESSFLKEEWPFPTRWLSVCICMKACPLSLHSLSSYTFLTLKKLKVGMKFSVVELKYFPCHSGIMWVPLSQRHSANSRRPSEGSRWASAGKLSFRFCQLLGLPDEFQTPASAICRPPSLCRNTTSTITCSQASSHLLPQVSLQALWDIVFLTIQKERRY